MDVELLKKEYSRKNDIIKKRLKDFKNIKEDEWFYELCFCILTPQSSAKKADAAIEELKGLRFKERNINPAPYLIKNTRILNLITSPKYLITSILAIFFAYGFTAAPAAAILLILGLVFFWQQDKILSLGQTPSQLLSQEILISSTKSDQPNFILAQEKKVNIFLKISTTGLDYLAAEQSIKQQALAKAIGQAQTNLISNNFLVEEPIKINIVNLSPLPTEFKSGDNLQILAEYTFLYFDTTPVKNILLSYLASKKAAKLSQMSMQNLSFADFVLDQKTGSFKLKGSANFVK